MNIYWMGLFAAIIFAEKFWTRGGPWIGRITGIGFITLGILSSTGAIPLPSGSMSGSSGSSSTSSGDIDMMLMMMMMMSMDMPSLSQPHMTNVVHLSLLQYESYGA
jgi:hypothetical protein